MSPKTTAVFLWTDIPQEKKVVAASACSDGVEIYYALENSCSRQGNSFTVSSQNWFSNVRRYWIEELFSPAENTPA
jgi:hypothetical protein